MSVYRITSTPGFRIGGSIYVDEGFAIGDTVKDAYDEVDADSDGDIAVVRLSDSKHGRLSPTCLTDTRVAPRNDTDVDRVSVRALRAALSLGEASGKDIDDLVRVVQILDAAYPA